MFWKTRKRFEDQVRAMVSQSAVYSGANRRAINLVPLPIVSDGHEIAQTQTVRYHQLLVSIEGNQRTCCLKIISPRKKSRSAILIFRGRVLGCLYGRKNLGCQAIQQDAQMHAMSDLATAGNVLDAYQLPEDLVLAAASLFHGQVLEVNQRSSPAEQLSRAIADIVNAGLPGCIVVSNSTNEIICQVYLSSGRIIGVYASADGWLEPSERSAGAQLTRLRDVKVMASVLVIRTMDDVAALGFSLTGLGDRRFAILRQEQLNKWGQATSAEFSEYSESVESWYSKYSTKQQSSHWHYGRPGQTEAASHAHYPNTRRLSGVSAVRHAHSIDP